MGSPAGEDAPDDLTTLAGLHASLREQHEVLRGVPGAHAERGLTHLQAALDAVAAEALHLGGHLVRAYTRRFLSAGHASSEDLEAAGTAGLLHALDTYDSTKLQFGQWAFRSIQREVLRAVRDAAPPRAEDGSGPEVAD